MATAAEIDVKGLERLKDLYGDLAQLGILTGGRIAANNGKHINVSHLLIEQFELKKNDRRGFINLIKAALSSFKTSITFFYYNSLF